MAVNMKTAPMNTIAMHDTQRKSIVASFVYWTRHWFRFTVMSLFGLITLFAFLVRGLVLREEYLYATQLRDKGAAFSVAPAKGLDHFALLMVRVFDPKIDGVVEGVDLSVETVHSATGINRMIDRALKGQRPGISGFEALS